MEHDASSASRKPFHPFTDPHFKFSMIPEKEPPVYLANPAMADGYEFLQPLYSSFSQTKQFQEPKLPPRPSARKLSEVRQSTPSEGGRPSARPWTTPLDDRPRQPRSRGTASAGSGCGGTSISTPREQVLSLTPTVTLTLTPNPGPIPHPNPIPNPNSYPVPNPNPNRTSISNTNLSMTRVLAGAGLPASCTAAVYCKSHNEKAERSIGPNHTLRRFPAHRSRVIGAEGLVSLRFTTFEIMIDAICLLCKCRTVCRSSPHHHDFQHQMWSSR